MSTFWDPGAGPVPDQPWVPVWCPRDPSREPQRPPRDPQGTPRDPEGYPFGPSLVPVWYQIRLIQVPIQLPPQGPMGLIQVPIQLPPQVPMCPFRFPSRFPSSFLFRFHSGSRLRQMLGCFAGIIPKQCLHYGVLAEHKGLVGVTGLPALWGTRQISNFLRED